MRRMSDGSRPAAIAASSICFDALRAPSMPV
jgi:hypothetical protein